MVIQFIELFIKNLNISDQLSKIAKSQFFSFQQGQVLSDLNLYAPCLNFLILIQK